MMQTFSIVVLVLLGLVMVYLLLYLILVRTMFNLILKRKNTKVRIDSNDSIKNLYQLDLDWLKKQKFEVLTIINEDNLKLKARLFSCDKPQTVILCHGYASDWREMANYIKMFFSLGYNVLVPDNRAHGQSEGALLTMGVLESRDVVLWTKLMKEKQSNYSLGLFGLSMGASTVMFALGEEDLPKISFAICDCGYKNVYEQFKHVGKKRIKKLTKFVLNAFIKYVDRAYEINLKTADVTRKINTYKGPILLIHGGQDGFVPVENAYDIFEKLKSKTKELFIVENAKHAQNLNDNPKRYQQKIRNFILKNKN